RPAAHHPDADGAHKIEEGQPVPPFPLPQVLEGVAKGDEGAGDGSRPGAPVGLEDIAVDPDGPLPQLLQVDHGPQAPADEALDLVSPAGDPPPGSLPGGPLLGG